MQGIHFKCNLLLVLVKLGYKSLTWTVTVVIALQDMDKDSCAEVNHEVQHHEVQQGLQCKSVRIL